MENSANGLLRPTFGGSFENGINVMSKQFLPLLAVVLVVGFVQAPIQAGRFIVQIVMMKMDTGGQIITGGIFLIFAMTYGFLLLSVFDYGSTFMFLKAVRGEKADFTNLVRGFRENYVDILLANLLCFGIIFLGMIFFIIPGIILSCRLGFVKYLVMDKKMNAIEAVEESWRMTRGHGWTIFFMAFVSFFIIIFGILMLIVGIFPAIIFISSAFASLYEAVLTNNGLYRD